ncbi:hypothetical protein M8C21_012848 [Ambrosia artemisiifolia]|uniref:Uncharacterized protein n=1 Tax=Ambrosia artemisiifolia TaxID=4212 RepID=A0AAD5BJY3_AMBAR|nr:hypothetical protein M8C21_012848 [Ambrosia artemisiifolia]
MYADLISRISAPIPTPNTSYNELELPVQNDLIVSTVVGRSAVRLGELNNKEEDAAIAIDI